MGNTEGVVEASFKGVELADKMPIIDLNIIPKFIF